MTDIVLRPPAMTEHAVPIPETPQVPVVPPVQTRPPKVRTRPTSSLLDPSILRHAMLEAFVKLDSRTMIRNPVMFVVARAVTAAGSRPSWCSRCWP